MYRRSRFFDDFVRPLETWHMICGAAVNPRFVSALSSHRSAQAGVFGPRHQSELDQLNGYLARLGHLFWQESQLKLARSLSLPLVEVSTRGAEYINDPAMVWFASHKDVARCTDRGLTLRDASADARLHQLITVILDGRWSDLPVGDLLVPLADAGKLLLVPTASRESDLVRRTVVQLVLLVSGESLLNRTVDECGLTPAESAIVRALVSGRSLVEYAHTCRKSVHTVRTQMKNSFEKTGCHSQVALIARMTGPVE